MYSVVKFLLIGQLLFCFEYTPDYSGVVRLEGMNMRKQLIFFAIIAILFCSCTGFFDLSEEERIVGNSSGEIQQSNTKIKFYNASPFPVEVFNSLERKFSVSDKINLVQPYTTSDEIPWFPTSGEPFSFYLKYHLTGIYDDISIPFFPNKLGIDIISINIPFEKTTTVTIPNIKNFIDPEETLINDVGIIIRNNFNSAVYLLKGNIYQNLINLPGDSINPNQYGFYRIPANSTGYSIQSNNIHSLPMTTLTAGNIYIISVYTNGNPAYTADFPLTMDLF